MQLVICGIATLFKKIQNATKREEESGFLIIADIAFIGNNQNLKYYPTMINAQTLGNNTFIPLIITNYSDNKVCLFKNIAIGTYEEI